MKTNKEIIEWASKLLFEQLSNGSFDTIFEGVYDDDKFHVAVEVVLRKVIKQKDKEWTAKMIEVLQGFGKKERLPSSSALDDRETLKENERMLISHGYNECLKELKEWQAEQINKLTK